MNLIGTYKATRSPEFTSRVTAAIVLCSQDVLNDPSRVYTNPWNAAKEVMRIPEHHAWITQVIWKVAADPAVASTVDESGNVKATDQDILHVVSGAWSEMFPDEVA